MNQALENIRNRIDAFGTAEPLLFVSGDTIEVQIPGLARGTIDEHPKTQFCVTDSTGNAYGCHTDQAATQAQLDGASVHPVVDSVCLTGDVWGDTAPCFGTEKDAKAAIDAIKVEKQQQQFCLTGTGLSTDPCFPSRDQADAALAGIGTSVSQTYCVQGSDGQTFSSDAGPACSPNEQEARQPPGRHERPSPRHTVLRRQLGRGEPGVLPRPRLGRGTSPGDRTRAIAPGDRRDGAPGAAGGARRAHAVGSQLRLDPAHVWYGGGARDPGVLLRGPQGSRTSSSTTVTAPPGTSSGPSRSPGTPSTRRRPCTTPGRPRASDRAGRSGST